MAKTKIETFKTTVDSIKEHAFEVNDFTIDTVDEVVDVVLKNSREWQKLFGKVAKNGSKLLWKQQDLAISALENVGDQVVENNQKLAEFLEVENVVSFFKSATKKAKAQLEKVEVEAKKKAKVKTAYPKFEKKGKKAKKKLSKKIKGVTNTVANTVSNTVTNTVAEKAPKAGKTAKKLTKKVVVKPSKVTKTVASKGKVERKVVRTIRKDDLRTIKGIGPKTEKLLNDEGIYSFAQLAKASNKKLKTVLDLAGPRFANFDSSIWTKQAKAQLK